MDDQMTEAGTIPGTDEGPDTTGWKLAVAVRDDLAQWQRLNVTAFVVSGIGSRFPTLVGQPYEDGSQRRYLPMFVTPVLVHAGPGDALRRAFDRSLERGLPLALYTDELFATGNDNDNRAAVAAVATAELTLAGFAVAGPARQVDKAFDKLRLHPA